MSDHQDDGTTRVTEEHTNIDAHCLLCWTSFVTTLEAIDDKTAECPKCEARAVAEKDDG